MGWGSSLDFLLRLGGEVCCLNRGLRGFKDGLGWGGSSLDVLLRLGGEVCCLRELGGFETRPYGVVLLGMPKVRAPFAPRIGVRGRPRAFPPQAGETPPIWIPAFAGMTVC